MVSRSVQQLLTVPGCIPRAVGRELVDINAFDFPECIGEIVGVLGNIVGAVLVARGVSALLAPESWIARGHAAKVNVQHQFLVAKVIVNVAGGAASEKVRLPPQVRIWLPTLDVCGDAVSAPTPELYVRAGPLHCIFRQISFHSLPNKLIGSDLQTPPDLEPHCPRDSCVLHA